jgi:hypothetical protein
MTNWTVVSGAPQLDTSIGLDPPSLRVGNQDTQATLFGQSPQIDSLYLSNPETADFQNGTIEFDIYFDNQPGAGDRAVITFRMLDRDTYYGALLSNTLDWNSNFIIVRHGVASTIGNVSSAQAFPTHAWSHVKLAIDGSTFALYKDDLEIASARDVSWGDGKWGGLGIYSAYFNGVFHIDNFSVHDTSRPLIFVAPFTLETTVLTTSVSTTYSTFLSSITVFSTVTTTTSSTLLSSITVFSTISMTTSSTFTSLITQSKIPIPDDPLFLIAFVGLIASIYAGYFKKETVAFIAAIVLYEFGLLGFVFTGVSQLWFTFDDGFRILLGSAVTPLIGFVIGGVLENLLHEAEGPDANARVP